MRLIDDPREGARPVIAMQGLLAGARLSLQAEPSSRVATHQDHGERPAFDMVAGGAIAEVFMAKRRISSIDLSWRFVEMTRDEAVFQWGFAVAIVPDPKLGWRAVMPARQNREMSAAARKRFKAIEKELRGKYSLSNF